MPRTATEQSKILILDFGSQYTQLIARRVREQRVYCEIHPASMSFGEIGRALGQSQQSIQKFCNLRGWVTKNMTETEATLQRKADRKAKRLLIKTGVDKAREKKDKKDAPKGT